MGQNNTKQSINTTLIFDNIKENKYTQNETRKVNSNKQLIIDTLKHINNTQKKENQTNLNYNFKYISQQEEGSYYKTSLSNHFVGTLLESYNNHIPLELKPDTVWFSIVGSLSHYIDKNSKQFRQFFVDFDGKKELEVKTNYDLFALSEKDYKVWDKLFDQMHELIRANTKNNLAEWAIPNFSTTTEKDNIIGKFILMAACKNYFTYTFSTECGIPKVTLLGTVDDWILLKKKLDTFDIFDDIKLSHWKRKLCTILDHFIESFNGKKDIDFWGKIMSVDRTFGSGATTYFSGWATVFNPFDTKGHYVLLGQNDVYCQINIKHITFSCIDFDVNLNNNGCVHLVKGVVGCFGSSYKSDTNTLSPTFDFALLD